MGWLLSNRSDTPVPLPNRSACCPPNRSAHDSASRQQLHAKTNSKDLIGKGNRPGAIGGPGPSTVLCVPWLDGAPETSSGFDPSRVARYSCRRCGPAWDTFVLRRVFPYSTCCFQAYDKIPRSQQQFSDNLK